MCGTRLMVCVHDVRFIAPLKWLVQRVQTICGLGLSSGQIGSASCPTAAAACMGVYMCWIIFLQACTSATVRGMSLAVVATMASAQDKAWCQQIVSCRHIALQPPHSTQAGNCSGDSQDSPKSNLHPWGLMMTPCRPSQWLGQVCLYDMPCVAAATAFELCHLSCTVDSRCRAIPASA